MKNIKFFAKHKKKLNKFYPIILAIIITIILIQQPKNVWGFDNKSNNQIEIEAERLYQQNNYPEAIATLKIAIQQYQAQGNRIETVIATRNLALIYQQLGNWQQATTTLEQAEKIISTIDNQSERSQLLAQVLEVKGQVELSLGRSQNALDTWKKATALYQQQQNITGVTQSTIYQAYALQALGLYSQSIKTLTTINEQLQHKPDNLVKAKSLLSLGNVLDRVGKYQLAQDTLASGLNIAQKTEDKTIIAETILSLGHNARLQDQPEVALDFYQQASNLSPSANIKLKVKLARMQILIEQSDKPTLKGTPSDNGMAPLRTLAINEGKQIKQLLTKLPPQQTTIQGQISLARNLIQLETNPRQIAKFLANSIEQARSLDIKRNEAEALGVLGNLYERHQKWQEASQITEQALMVAQSINAPELTYQWQWQLGRILKAQGESDKAIIAYTQATNNLQSLRSDLVAISSDIQFSFQEKIEPVYRELTALLLEPGANQVRLKQARTVIESLQVAKLDNFFRDACLDTQPSQIDTIDPQAAVIYTIILGDRLEVVAAIADRPLRHYRQGLPPSEIEIIISSAQSQLTEPRRLNLQLLQQAYDWLIRPVEADLNQNQIKTIVFVPDGILRNLPPATLHDGKQYLVEKYAVAIAPSLQLTQLQTPDSDSQDILLAGLSQSRQGVASLPGVKQEIEQIAPLFTSRVLLNNSFTELNFNRSTSQTPFRVVHLATHGQFSSNAEDTFILTWDNRINIDELNSLLRGDSKQLRPIDLLVLSACETATGDRTATLGLAGIAVRAGAKRTIDSLWPVSDLATVTLMTNFYQKLSQGNITKAEALRQAQISVLKQDIFDHPFFWSAFILVGNWQ
ncbi:MAG: CHAT domain-containing protein [Pleurocapsa sp.]